MKTSKQIFEDLRVLIVEQLGVKPDKVTFEASFVDDLGVSGDDGVELFEMLDVHYDIEWHGLDLGVLFGNEGFGPPPPWALRNNCILYKPQPCYVGDVVKAIENGIWKATPLTLKSSKARLGIYAASYLYFGALMSTLGFGIFNTLL